MIALDTNLLVYARRREAPHHRQARLIVEELAQGQIPWALPWPCVYEFVRIVTHPRVFRPPSPLGDVLEDLENLLESPSVMLLGAGAHHRTWMARMLAESHATGNLAHDAQIAALVLEHGVDELWTADRDFRRFPGVAVRNPLDGSTTAHERRALYRAGGRRRRVSAE